MTEPLHALDFEWTERESILIQDDSSKNVSRFPQIWNYLPHAFVGIFGTVLGATLIISLQNSKARNIEPAIVTLDMKKVIRAEAGRLSIKNTDEDQIKSDVKDLPKRLDQVLKNLFGDKKPLILKPGAVITSLRDITPEVLKALQEQDPKMEKFS